MMPKFVLVTPVLNGALFLAETLASVTGQSDPDWVHYVVDGGSTDATLQIVRTSMTGDPRRRLIEGQDRGMYDAVFKGFEQARADGFSDPDAICLWLNADDLLMPWALASLRVAFAQTSADWITSLPCFWDEQARIELLLPYAWYPRRLIRMGLFQESALGCIQQESSFFTRGLLDRLPPGTVEAIRSMRLAGDFVLWRAFARITAPTPLPLPLSGFRSHGANASATQAERYYAEIAASGIWIVPPRLGRIMRMLFRPIALFQAATAIRSRAQRVAQGTREKSQRCAPSYRLSRPAIWPNFFGQWI